MTASKMRAVLTALLLGTTALGGAVVLCSSPAMAANVRPEVGNPLREAQSLAAAGNYKAALAKVNEAEAVSGKTSDETAIIGQMKQYIGVKSGDASIGGAAGAKAKFANDYNARKYSDVIADGDVMRKSGALDTASMQVIAQSYYLSGNKPGCIKYIKSNFPTPDDTTLELLMRCAYDAGDDMTQREALESLVAHTGKTEYWSALLKLSEHASGMADHQTLDIYRLKLATGTINGKDEYTLLAQLALQLGFPAEGQAVIEKGMALNLLNDDRSKRLLALAKQQAGAAMAGRAAALAAASKVPQGDDLIKIAEQQWGSGDAKGALATAQAGLAKGPKDKDNATIVLGMAQLAAGQKADAIKTFGSVKGPSNAASIAHLNALYAAHAPAAAAPGKKG